MGKVLYKGWSTKSWLMNKSFRLNDIALVEEDLLNQIFTVVGERLFMPNFGTRIPIITFEPNDNTTLEIIKADLTSVFDYDPRVQLINLNVMALPTNKAIIAIATLLYVEFNVTQPLNIEFPTTA